jgi:hypothetical protein
MRMHGALLVLGISSADALMLGSRATVHQWRRAAPTMEFGAGFGSYYSGWADLVKEYPQADRDAYPALFSLPDDCYEVVLDKPLGIAFIENDDGGVCVDYLVEGANAEKSGVIKPGDVLLATTACMGRDGKFERKLIPSRYIPFDTIMGAIGSNEPRFNKQRKNDVILQFARPTSPYEDEGDPYDGGKRGIKSYMKSLEFPSDSPWLAR